jgi:hypothetical protein
MTSIVKNRQALIRGAILIAVLLAILFWFFPRAQSVEQVSSFDYLTDRARQLNLNVDEIVAFVHDQIAADNSYQGALRGPVGTLWAGSGSDLDRALLLQGLLERASVKSRLARGETYGVQIDQGQGKFRYVGPARDLDLGATPLAAPPSQELHALMVILQTWPKDGAEPKSEEVALHTADLSGHDITLFYRQRGQASLAVVSIDGRETISTLDAATARRQQLIFRMQAPDGKTIERRRELFTREFADFPSFFDPSNRYTVVVTAGRVPDWVDRREESEAKLKADKAPIDARNHVVAFRFLALSDAHTQALMAAKDVRAALSSPRITIVADEPMDQSSKGARAVSIDLRKNDLHIVGEPRTQAAFASARSLFDAALESEVLHAVTGMASFSATTALANVQQSVQSSIAQRQELFRSLLSRLLSEGRQGASLSFGPAGMDAVSVSFETTASGLKIKPSAAVAAALANARGDNRWLLDQGAVSAEQIGRAAVEMEVALVTAAKLPPNYQPVFKYSGAAVETWYVNSRRFSFVDGRVSNESEIKSFEPDIVSDEVDHYDWTNHSWFGSPTHDMVVTKKEDFLHARVYTTWFCSRTGVDGRTFDMLSRDAYSELKRDGSTVLRFRFCDGSESDPIKLWAFPGKTEFIFNNEKLTVRVLAINGDYEKNNPSKPENAGSGPTLPDKLGGNIINRYLVLDDERFPVFVGSPTRVQSDILGRVVDAATGKGVDQAKVAVSASSATSWPDGSFSLPIIREPFNVFDVKIEAPGYSPKTVSIDFRAADSLPLKLQLTQLAAPSAAPPLWIDQSNVNEALNGSALSPHTKRLISESIAADPALGMLVPRQDVWGPDGKIDAWLEMNTASFEVYGMLSDGLYGSTSRVLGACVQSMGGNAGFAYATGGAPDPTKLPNCGISYFSGRIAAWYLFAAGALDSVSKAVDGGDASIEGIYKNAVATAHLLARQCYGWTDGAAGTAASLLLHNNGAFKLGLRDGLEWADEFYGKAWGVNP